MPLYSVDQLLALQQSDLVEAPKFLYEEIKDVHWSQYMTYAPPNRHGFHIEGHHQAHGGNNHHAAAAQEETFNPHDLNKSLEEREDLDEDIKELTSRYFLQRDNLYKKLHMGSQTTSGAELIGIKTSSIGGHANGMKSHSSSNAFDALSGEAAGEAEVDATAASDQQDDDDGWISVGPKHHNKDHHHAGGWGGHGSHHGHGIHHHGHGGHHGNHPRRSFGGADRGLDRRQLHRKLEEEHGSAAAADHHSNEEALS